MALNFIDLHTHSNCSDGSDSPSELIKKAKKSKLSAIALTDHDTIAGIPEAKTKSQELNIEFIPGCELATEWEFGEIHILGLWVKHDDKNLINELKELQNARYQRNIQIIKKLQSLNIKIEYDYVKEICNKDKLQGINESSLGRPHIAHALIELKEVENNKEAFTKYLAKNAPAYVSRRLFPLKKTIEILKNAGGTVVWAHPMLTSAPNELIEQKVKEMTNYGLDALEVYHSEHSSEGTRFCVELAKNYNLDISGGSDYHGELKPGVKLGSGRGGLRVAEFVLEKLKERRKRQGLMI
ncbi:PHP domain-containing protein [Desulfovibrio litoralis]|uniref:Polymerase/histidinol phosphatase N-terminal domain-containing protein n=1 Tax=Desulfovibrio litoralis DSM 11393 TaxID=1121455 RepID=A0A1M7RTJ1_9BACT|nr:PHP domain-containing protein [Desulfovibrio litoralis]SHN49657.1 hypothetical protein SAMN02745728_00157 [Desulfovibrio litoralis DSM 11393]